MNKPYDLHRLLTSRAIPPLILLLIWGIAVFSAGAMTRELIHASTTVNRQMAEEVRLIGVILQRSTELERKARLLILLSDPMIREPYEEDAYEKTRQAYHKAIGDLNAVVTDPETILAIQEIKEEEALIHQKIKTLGNSSSVPSSGLDQPFADFSDMTLKLAIRLDAETQKALDQNVQRSETRLARYVWSNLISLLLGFLAIGLLWPPRRPIKATN